MAGMRSSTEEESGLSLLLLLPLVALTDAALVGEVVRRPSGRAEPPLWCCIQAGTAESAEVEEEAEEAEAEAELESEAVDEAMVDESSWLDGEGSGVRVMDCGYGEV